jgi:hypothetical protein
MSTHSHSHSHSHSSSPHHTSGSGSHHDPPKHKHSSHSSDDHHSHSHSHSSSQHSSDHHHHSSSSTHAEQPRSSSPTDMAANTGTQRTVPEKKFSGAKVHKVSNVLKKHCFTPHTSSYATLPTTSSFDRRFDLRYTILQDNKVPSMDMWFYLNGIVPYYPACSIPNTVLRYIKQETFDKSVKCSV